MIESVTESFLERAMIPVASREDAAATTAALAPHLESSGGTVIAVHVIEKAGGALDKASVEQREQAALDIFDIVTESLRETDVTLESEILYGTDVAQTLIDGAHEHDVSAIVFTPRGASRWEKLLSGDVTHKLVEHTDVPVLVFPPDEVSEE